MRVPSREFVGRCYRCHATTLVAPTNRFPNGQRGAPACATCRLGLAHAPRKCAVWPCNSGETVTRKVPYCSQHLPIVRVVGNVREARRIEIAGLRHTIILPQRRPAAPTWGRGADMAEARRILPDAILRVSKCFYCPKPATTRDHVIPFTQGGRARNSDGSSNIVPACRSCNSSKGAKTPEQWAKSKAGIWVPEGVFTA